MSTRQAIGSAFAFIGAVLLFICIVFSQVIFFGTSESEGLPTVSAPVRTVIIDAGHGGMDGGAVAPDGTAEKDINLKISLTLGALMRASGYNVILTRENDVMLDTNDGKGSAKMRDLRRRLEIASEHPDAITVSIHCNKFPQSSCKGMQVYHSDSDVAKQAAELVQKSSLAIMPDNHRKIKKADSSIYLLHRACAPAILVECGFLSNESELQNLKAESYQKKLALVIFSGIDAAHEI